MGSISTVFLNRPAFAIANRVEEFVAAVTGAKPRQATQPADVPAEGVELLVVGQRHLMSDSTQHRFGYDVLMPAVRRARPKAVVYIVPGRFDPEKHEDDRSALEQATEFTSVFVLEFARLQVVPEARAVTLARRALQEQPDDLSRKIRMLIPSG
jgi:hypothetical protein